jgi:hypothetical protein
VKKKLGGRSADRPIAITPTAQEIASEASQGKIISRSGREIGLVHAGSQAQQKGPIDLGNRGIQGEPQDIA